MLPNERVMVWLGHFRELPVQVRQLWCRNQNTHPHVQWPVVWRQQLLRVKPGLSGMQHVLPSEWFMGTLERVVQLCV